MIEVPTHEEAAKAPSHLLRDLRANYFNGSIRDLATALGADPAAICLWEGERLHQPERRYVKRLPRLVAACIAVEKELGSAKEAGQWIITPNPQLNNRMPAWHLQRRHRVQELRALVSSGLLAA